MDGLNKWTIRGLPTPSPAPPPPPKEESFQLLGTISVLFFPSLVHKAKFVSYLLPPTPPLEKRIVPISRNHLFIIGIPGYVRNPTTSHTPPTLHPPPPPQKFEFLLMFSSSFVMVFCIELISRRKKIKKKKKQLQLDKQVDHPYYTVYQLLLL